VRREISAAIAAARENADRVRGRFGTPFMRGKFLSGGGHCVCRLMGAVSRIDMTALSSVSENEQF
jgi:hypothetical protein